LAALASALLPLALGDGSRGPAGEGAPRAQVVDLTTEDFDSSVQNGTTGPWFVKFYAPWCGHCQRLAPKWEQLAERLQGEVTVAQVDATVEKELAERWAVEGYPTLILVAESAGYVYEGARSVEALEAYARGGYAQDPGPASVPGATEEEEEASLDSIRLTNLTLDASLRARGTLPWFINFHMPSCGFCKELAPMWEELARDLKGKVNVAKVNVLGEQALAKHWGADRFPTLRLVVAGAVYDYDGEREAAALRAFALGGYSSASPLALPEPLRPLPTTLLEGLLARQHLIVAFLGGIVFASLVSLAWVHAFPQRGEPGDGAHQAPVTGKKDQ